MKRSIIILLILFNSLCSFGIKYYVATTGNDSGTGAIGDPWLTWEHIHEHLTAGDTCYIRGGTYTTHSESALVQCNWHNMTGTSSDTIKIWAYPGEVPIWSFAGVTFQQGERAIIYMNHCDYVWVRGLKIRDASQFNSVSQTYGWDILNSSHNKIENCEISYMTYGFCINNSLYQEGVIVENSSDNLFLNCDAHHLSDPLSPTPYGGSNGFNITATGQAPNTTFRGCRAWYCSDDGWDLYNIGAGSAVVTIDRCWSFWNGYIPGTFTTGGDGSGYKLGPATTSIPTTLMTKVTNSMAIGNRQFGFNQNSLVYEGITQYFNNLAYGNLYGWVYWADIGVIDVLKNNIAYGNIVEETYNISWNDDTYNSWNGGVTVSVADFVSLDTLLLDNARQSDGSLPVITFGHLAAGSDLIGAGIGVGLTYDGDGLYHNDPPDLGPFAYNGAEPEPPELPQISTTAITTYNAYQATVGGNITSNGGGTVSAAGVCWNTAINPTTANSKITSSAVTGAFSGILYRTLLPGVTYHVRSYATNETGTSYGADVSITIPKNTIMKTGAGKYYKYGKKTLIYK